MDSNGLKLSAAGAAAFRCAQARYAAYAAAACGYAFRSLDGADGYLFEVRDGARRALFAAGAGTPYALNDARAAALARDKAFCAEALRAAEVPTLPGRMFFITERWAEMRGPGRELEDARRHVAQADYPVFCKPIDASNGLYAEVVDSPAAFEDYVARVSGDHFAILVQPYVRAPEYRVFILNGAPLFSYRKRLPRVVGDGRSTIAALAGGRTHARLADGALLAGDHVLAAGAEAVLEGPANRAAGGGACALRDLAPAPLASIACAAASAVDLTLAAVDIFDLSTAGDLSYLSVIEVNSNPMIATLEENGRWDLIEAIWRANLTAALK